MDSLSSWSGCLSWLPSGLPARAAGDESGSFADHGAHFILVSNIREPHGLLWILAITVVLFVSAILLQQMIEERCSGAELSLGLALSAGAGGIAIFLGGSAVLGQISGALGLILGVVAILAFFFNATVGPIVPLIYVMIFGSLLLNGCLFAQLPWLTAILLWITPWALLFGQRSDQPRLGRRAGALCLRLIGVVIMVAVALGSVFLLAPPSSDI